jgi:hypothetical protein
MEYWVGSPAHHSIHRTSTSAAADNYDFGVDAVFFD